MIFLLFICQKTKLVERLTNVQRAVSTKSNLAALEGVYIETEENQTVKIKSYNMELGIETNIPATIKEPGKIILNAKLFTDIIRKLPEEQITIETRSNLNTVIKSGKSKFNLMGIDPEEFPSFPNIETPETITIPVNIIKSMIKQTLFAVSDSEDKPIHTGTLFEIKNQEIKLVSVDGYRLALRKENIAQDTELKFVVPGKTLNEILKLLPENEEKQLIISIGMRNIAFKTDDYFIISRLLEGEFLDYKESIPNKFTTKAEIKTRELIDAIERVSLLITDNLRSSVKCLFGTNQIKISCTTTVGNADDEISAEITGENVEIGVNNRYIIDALKNAETDEVIMELNGSLSPIKIVPKNNDVFLFLVLPVRLRSE